MLEPILLAIYYNIFQIYEQQKKKKIFHLEWYSFLEQGCFQHFGTSQNTSEIQFRFFFEKKIKFLSFML